jgi:two-component system chemotaxis response regulator CheB
MMKTRVLVVDDTVTFRRIISEALSTLPGVEVVGNASNGKLALARLASLQPDLLTLDIEMPEMNGIEVLQAMAAAGLKAGVIMLSANTVRGGQITIRALELGAFDFITKPDGGSPEAHLAWLRGQLAPIIRAFERQREIRSILAHKPLANKPRPPAEAPQKSARGPGSPILLIGVSTGGPSALAEVLPALPRKLGAPLLIVQHMPPMFTQALAERLQSRCAIRVKEAENGEIALPDCAYLAPGGRQMKLAPGQNGQIVIQLSDDPPENNCRPSVDYLFRSAATHFPGRSVAAILTGMGNDGTEGLRLLKQTGAASIAQDEASCVVFGMPREAILAGVVDMVVPLNRIADTMMRCLAEARA